MARFPGALITDFAFLPEDTDWGHAGFLERAQSLLEAVEADRGLLSSGAVSDDPSDIYLPYVWLGHDLGGSLIKQVGCIFIWIDVAEVLTPHQALVLATQDRKYSHLASEAAILVRTITRYVRYWFN